MAIKEQVDRELSRWLVGGSSAWNVGLGTTTFTADGTSLRPVRLAECLEMAGSIGHVEVSTKTLAAASGVLLNMVGAAASPPLRVEARGVSLRIGPRSRSDEARAGGGDDRQKAADEALKRLGRLTVDARDIAVEFLLCGRRAVARLRTVLAEPLPQGRALAKWTVKHSDIREPRTGSRSVLARPPQGPEGAGKTFGCTSSGSPRVTLELDGRTIGRVGAGSTEVVIAHALRRVDVSLGSDVDAGVDVAELLAILDIVAALVAAAAAEAAAAEASRDQPRAFGMPWGFGFQRASAKLELDRQSGDPLLEVSCERGSVSDVPGSKTEVHAELLQVRQGDAAAVSSWKVLVQGAQQGGVSIEHWFPVEGDGKRALPWAGCLDFLTNDPRFSEHKAWLQRARDVAVVGKRPRQAEGSSPDAEMKRSRM